MALVLVCDTVAANSLGPRLVLKHGGVGFELEDKGSPTNAKAHTTAPLTLRERDTNEEVTTESGIYKYLCSKYITLATMYPTSNPEQGFVDKALAFVEDTLTPAVSQCLDDHNDAALLAVWDQLATGILQPATGMVSRRLSVADVAIVCAVRPFLVNGGVVPDSVLHLADVVATVIESWPEVVGEFDKHNSGVPLEGPKAFPMGHWAIWNTNVSNKQPVVPADLLVLAENFDIDIEEEASLLWLLRQALETPLPPGWQLTTEATAEFLTAPPPVHSSRTGASSHRSGASKMTPTVRTTRSFKSTSRSAATHGTPTTGRGGTGAGGGAGAGAGAGATAAATPSSGGAVQAGIGAPGSAAPGQERMMFANEDAGKVSETHPATEFLLKQIADARQFARIIGSGLGVEAFAGSGAWMKFKRPPEEVEAEREAKATEALEDAASKARLGVGAAVRSEDEDPTSGIVVLTSYYYDFETATTADALPMNARLIPPPPAPAYHSAAVLETPGTANTFASTLPYTEPAGIKRSTTKKSKVDSVETLHFRSWWSEGKAVPVATASNPSYSTHVLDVFFELGTGAFKVALEGDDKLYSISHIEGRNGPLECWDLWVGARVNILGRQTTLKQANLTTQQWLDHHARRLQKLIERMEAELVKYDTAAAYQLKKRRQHPVVTGGRTWLRAKLDYLDLLRRKLAVYRPKVAQQILKSLDRQPGRRAGGSTMSTM